MKRIAVVAISIFTIFVLASCGKFTCALCFQEKSGKQYIKEVLGQEIVYCKDCHELDESLSDMLQ